MSHLVPCPGCQRHVRTHENECPFCRAALDLSALPPPMMPRARMGRAALFAFGATLAASLTTTGCGGDSDTDGTGGATTGGGGSGATGGGGSGGSGGGSGGATGGTAGQATGGDAGMQSLYGLPADAGLGGFAGNAALYGDPGVGGTGGDDGGGAALYGAPP